MLNEITPVILTFNEAPNIGRTLEKLRWASDIVVVDSFSDDETLAIVRNFSKARVFQRRFDSHANQWNFAISDTEIATGWVLALDADYLLSDGVISELENLVPPAGVVGYLAGFVYCVFGRSLRGSLYPPVTVLFRRDKGRYAQDGHTQRIELNGRVLSLKAKIMHDDRKPLSQWLRAQDRYTMLEADQISSARWGGLGGADKLRRFIFVAPFIVFLYCLFIKRAVLDGRAGMYYALQRLLAESLLSLRMLERKLKRHPGGKQSLY